MQVIWFKRDLRVDDNEALSEAAKRGPVLPLYILEPELWQQPDMSARHYGFLCECLRELDESLHSMGQGLIVKIGNAVDVLNDIHNRHGIDALWSHQETWNGWTYERDKQVLNWTNSRNIPWHEPAQNGVIRRLKNRDGWAAQWYRQMNKPVFQAPKSLNSINEISDTLPTSSSLGLTGDAPQRQKGDRAEGLKLLNSFLHERGEHYTKGMSSPVTAFDACSRLSPHIAFGTLSMREVFQACEQRSDEIKHMPYGKKGKWPSALRSFSGRLRWHCHFIQKLEDEPRIEFENMHAAYDGLRVDTMNAAYFEAWKNGMTGFPMVDACMRALNTTGYLNFRMRAMVMSFASYHLWLPWREPSIHLARMFTDYEPGIHYSQAQMQSGTTGINAIRIYNPIKQGVDHDPQGVFIREWIPELRDMDDKAIHLPWTAPSLMNGYPMPIIDEKAARKHAADHLYGLRKGNQTHKDTANRIVQKHGSRKSGLPRTVDKKPKNRQRSVSAQAELPL